jgi:hypothetical protein
MTTHIIWAIIWFALMIVSFYGGIVAAWLSGAAAVVLPKKTEARHAIGGLAVGFTLLLFGIVFAVFSAIKMVLQIIAAVQS